MVFFKKSSKINVYFYFSKVNDLAVDLFYGKIAHSQKINFKGAFKDFCFDLS